jgi:hypothetical protein
MFFMSHHPGINSCLCFLSKNHSPPPNWPICSPNQSYFTTGGLPPISSPWWQAPRLTTSNFIFQLNTCGYSPYVTSSLTRAWVLFTIAAGPRQRSHSQVQVLRDSWPHFTVSDMRLPQPGGPGPHIYIPRNRVVRLYPQALGSLFVASYDSQDLSSLSYKCGRTKKVTQCFVRRHHAAPRHIFVLLSNTTALLIRVFIHTFVLHQ